MSQNTLEVTITDRLGVRVVFTLRPGMSVAIIGTDGTGKSTAAHMLADHLREASIACERHHWYRWYEAALFVPIAVLLNRRRKIAVKIFDRTLFDNVATWTLSRRGAARTRETRGLQWTISAIALLYPHFDATIYLTARPEVIVNRRPETTIENALSALQVYNSIGSGLGLVGLDEIRITSRATSG